MSRYTVYYVLSLVLGIAIALMFSSLIHSSIDKPRGVPLAELGLAGTITQIGLMVFPFIFAPMPLGLAFFVRHKRTPTQNECRRLALNVGLLIFVVWLILFAASGIWFGIIQGGLWFSIGVLLGPPLLAAVTLWGIFPLASRSLNILQNR